MRKEREKREGIDCVKWGWEVQRDECSGKSIRLDDKEVIGIGRVDGKTEPDWVGIRSDE